MPVVSSPVRCLKILPSPYLSNHRPYALQVRASCMTLRYLVKPSEKADFFFSFAWKVFFEFWDNSCTNFFFFLKTFSVMHYAFMLNTWRRMNQIFLRKLVPFSRSCKALLKVSVIAQRREFVWGFTDHLYFPDHIASAYFTIKFNSVAICSSF